MLWRRDLPPAGQARLWFGWLPNGDFLSVARLSAAIGQYNAVTRRVCAATGADFVDLSAMDGDLDYFYDDCHLTEAGAARAAALVAKAMCRVTWEVRP